MLGSNYIRIIQEHYGNFVFSNFGSFNIEHGTIALSSPMTAGISMGALISSIQRINESYVETKYFLMSISFDHRVIDGAYVGRFMNALQQRIENQGE
jgi:pyruvate dehydrogenase E2 component (dihydrolipoamide acetyltransferase)